MTTITINPSRFPHSHLVHDQARASLSLAVQTELFRGPMFDIHSLSCGFIVIIVPFSDSDKKALEIRYFA